MKLIFALGNPGSDYAGTRHNTGFIAIDAYAKAHNVSFAEKTKFHAYIAEVAISGDKVLLVKPTTFYNNVGESARALIDFYKLIPNEDLLVIHDDLALPFGTIRIRQKGSDAGNNGIKSLNAHVGPNYTRVRVGIGIDGRASNDTAFVLDRFNIEEVRHLKDDVIPMLHTIANDFIAGRIEATSHRL